MNRLVRFGANYVLGERLLQEMLSAVFNYCWFAKVQIKNGNALLPLNSLFIFSSMKESRNFIFSQNSPMLIWLYQLS